MIVAKIGLTKPWEIKRDYSIYSNLSNGCIGFTFFYEYGFVKICVLVLGLGNNRGSIYQKQFLPYGHVVQLFCRKKLQKFGRMGNNKIFFLDKAISMTFAQWQWYEKLTPGGKVTTGWILFFSETVNPGLLVICFDRWSNIITIIGPNQFWLELV